MSSNELDKINDSLKEIKELINVQSLGYIKLSQLPFSVQTAYNYEKAGKLTITRPNGKNGVALVKKSDFDKLMEDGRKSAIDLIKKGGEL